MKPLITVIVPVFNVEAYIEDCITSILNQTYKNLEIIIVDDGSPDNSINLSKNITKGDNRVKYIVKSNGGLSDARNTGLREATGEFVTFIDSDDYIAPTYVERLYDVLIETAAEISIIALCQDIEGIIEHVVRSEQYLKIFTPQEAILAMYDKKDYFVVSLTVAQGKLYKRDLFNNISYPIGKKYEDSFTTYKLYKSSRKIAYLNDELYYYRIRKGSITNSGFSLANLDKLEMFEEKLTYISEYEDVSRKVRYAYCVELIRLSYQLRKHGQNNEKITEIRSNYRQLFQKVYKESNLKDRVKLVLYRYVPGLSISLSNRN